MFVFGGLRGTGRVVDSAPKVKLANYFDWSNLLAEVYRGTRTFSPDAPSTIFAGN